MSSCDMVNKSKKRKNQIKIEIDRADAEYRMNDSNPCFRISSGSIQNYNQNQLVIVCVLEHY